MRKIIKNVGSDMLFRLGLLQKLNFKTRIIAYHTVNPKYFEMQMKYLINNYKVVPLQDALKDLDKKQVVITFDDGYRNNLLCAYPVLKKLGLQATIFVTYEFADRNAFVWWDRLEYKGRYANLKELKTLAPDELEKRVYKITHIDGGGNKPKKYDFMSWAELKRSTDVFEIGSHTMTHPILTNVPIKQAHDEISRSKKLIEHKVGKKVMSFAYPNGDYNEKIVECVKNTGYKCAVLYDHWKTKSNNAKTDSFKLHRRGINFEDNLAAFACKVVGVF